MIAALYARRSVEQDINDDEKSVTQQLSNARAFAAAKGWDVIAEYVDDGVSGALSSKLVNRARMLADAAAEKFQAVIVRDIDRLSRNDEELPGLVYALRNAGVDVWTYTDRAKVETATAFSRGMLAMKATFAAAEREAAQKRVREAFRGKAQRGSVTGGRVFGYDNIRADAKSPVLRVVNDAEAAVVQRIFSLVANGIGLRKIAHALNTERVPGPRQHGWTSTAIREMLHRDLYRGKVVYGKTRWEYYQDRKDHETKKRHVPVPESEWIVREDPSLVIVNDTLLTAAHARLARTRAAYIRDESGRLEGKPETGLASAYLLAGFLRCGSCGGTLEVLRRSVTRVGYVCSNHRGRGASVCTNARALPLAQADQVVVESLRSVLTPERLDAALRGLIERSKDTAAVEAQRAALQADLATVEAEVANLTAALARFGADAPASVFDGLKARERARADLRAKLEHVDGLLRQAADALDLEAALAALREKIGTWTGYLQSDPAAGRQVLRRLLAGRVTAAPCEDGSWTVHGLGTLGQAFAALGLRVPEEAITVGDAYVDAFNAAHAPAGCSGDDCLVCAAAEGGVLDRQSTDRGDRSVLKGGGAPLREP